MRKRLDDEGAGRDRYGPYDGQRSRVGSSVCLPLDARKCAREEVRRDARAYVDARVVVPVKVRREKK
jgi:hypothetical protein